MDCGGWCAEDRGLAMQNINFYPLIRKPSPYDISGKRAKMWLTMWILVLLLISTLQFAYFLTQKVSLWYFESRRANIPKEMLLLGNASPDIKKIEALTTEMRAHQRELIKKNE